jgi:hypothetical protein
MLCAGNTSILTALRNVGERRSMKNAAALREMHMDGKAAVEGRHFLAAKEALKQRAARRACRRLPLLSIERNGALSRTQNIRCIGIHRCCPPKFRWIEGSINF